MRQNGYTLGEASFKQDLYQMVSEGKIARAGRDAYFVLPENLKQYHYDHSEKAGKIAGLLTDYHPYLLFTIFELVQVNEFVNHLLAHNILYVSVSKDVGAAVYDTLRQADQWVLLQPSQEIYHQYWDDDMIVINRLVSETPMTDAPKWSPRLEKILVDLMADKLIHESVSESELAGIYEAAFDRYVIDESALFRYARRRHAADKIKALIENDTKIELRTKTVC